MSESEDLVDGQPQTLADMLRALGHCEHADRDLPWSVVLDPHGARAPFRWCGDCGAVQAAPGASGWIRPALALRCVDDRIASTLGGFVRARITRLTRIARTMHAVCAGLDEDWEPERRELLAVALELESACEEFGVFLRETIGEFFRT